MGRDSHLSLHTRGVVGSIPIPPTTSQTQERTLEWRVRLRFWAYLQPTYSQLLVLRIFVVSGQ